MPEKLHITISLIEPNEAFASHEADAVAETKAKERGLALTGERSCIDGPSQIDSAYTQYEYTYNTEELRHV